LMEGRGKPLPYTISVQFHIFFDKLGTAVLQLPFLHFKLKNLKKGVDKSCSVVYNIIIGALEIKSIKAQKHKSAKATKGMCKNERSIKAPGFQVRHQDSGRNAA
ncbi:MAG: hypothetical protein SPD47_03490, partial [Oscillospiraceae bacterium]|nr:hypothetical protein [Oscillospiraceae bacterium]